MAPERGSSTTLHVGEGTTPLRDLEAVLRGPVWLELSDDARAAVAASRDTIRRLARGDEAIYGVNTGFGRLAGVRVAGDDLATLQVNLVRSHAAGVGEPLDPAVVRLVMFLKVVSLARGYSGVRQEILDVLCALIHRQVTPWIPSQGSVGASGDLAPLAHLALVLMGEGEALVDGRRVRGDEALTSAGVEPLALEAKEGLALLNGTQVSTALALRGLFEAERNVVASLVGGALSLDAIKGSDVPFDPRIHGLRAHAGQELVAARLRGLIQGSGIRESHRDCGHVQDPYSFRCQPQVLGAALDLLADVARRLVVEANAVSDNPLVFAADGEVLSGGNFHAQPVAFAADTMALAVAETGAISERRLAVMVDPALSGLPAFLAENPGLQSGYMIAQVTAAALASENKQLAHPASVDSLPTSANQEDHVSMATHAAARLGRMNANTRRILAIELMAAADGIDRRRPLRSSVPLERAHELIRDVVASRSEDRVFSGDIEAMAELVDAGTFDELVEPPLEGLLGG